MKHKRLKVIKVGGNVIDDQELLELFLKRFSTLSGHKLLIHGGGKAATRLSQSLGIETKMQDGRRITDKETLEVAIMIYAGLINKKIVAQLQAMNCNALGVTGADLNLITAQKRSVVNIDFGYVGDIEHVNSEIIDILLKKNISLVFCALTHDGKGQLLNTNADTLAAILAAELSIKYEVELFYCFEKQGVLQDVNDHTSVIPVIRSEEFEKLKADKIISAGMLPKLENAFSALRKGVAAVYIGTDEMLTKASGTKTILLR